MEIKLVVFKNKEIRRTLHNKEWWFSIADVCGALTDSPDAGAYWRMLKQRLSAKGSEVVTFCHRLKLPAPDGKMLRASARTRPRPARADGSPENYLVEPEGRKRLAAKKSRSSKD